MSKIRGKSHQMCCVVNCTYTQSKTESIKLFRFPSKPHDIEQRRKWIHAIKRKNADNKQWEPTPYSRICSAHFIGGQYSKHPQSPAYSPTLFPVIYKKSNL
ncbi:unnamed protein product [Macrosiphum euphorbiae]|uniref:THAP-type domain-containing protein n=1 Tax=Macrosiphum euphorbiae TaxID=13131 RepID=A0AAV0XT70_9HEMI|nr:unnamed protein product [Macrosiphum euphorbiae]